MGTSPSHSPFDLIKPATLSAASITTMASIVLKTLLVAVCLYVCLVSGAPKKDSYGGSVKKATSTTTKPPKPKCDNPCPDDYTPLCANEKDSADKPKSFGNTCVLDKYNCEHGSIIEEIKKDVTNHRLLVFKDQGVITGDRHVEISKWFGELEVTFYQHRMSPHPQVFRVSNDPNEGCTGVGRTGWHIDGTFQPAPYAYSLYYMASVPKHGATVFAPLTDIVEGLSPEKYAEWDRLWMASDRRSGPVHPLIYTHPRSHKKVLCVHLGMTDHFVYDYGQPGERYATPEEYNRLIKDINHEFVKDNGKIHYKHEWEEGDFIISDNCAVGHEASPETQAPRSKVGLRVLHRTTVHNPIPPAKAY